ncbi:MAG: saccharopine dehydrogenase C-terminal domain-containing protein, partial [Planctomycetota bacterium]
EVETLGAFEAYPNRDSLGYVDLYGLQEAQDMFRGTLRNLGHCDVWLKWVRLGLFDKAEREGGFVGSYRSLMAALAGAPGAEDVEGAVAAKMGVDPDDPAVEKLAWLGMLSDAEIPPRTPSVLDVLAGCMQERMPYGEGERDMLILLHKFEAEYPGGRREKIRSTLIDYGIPGSDSSMARTVSLPAAVATAMLARGEIKERGVKIPVSASIYEPVLGALKGLGIDCKETKEGA